ncbi:MAG: hypothetical protein HYR55_04250 [Acidobacteria bacterium]|nr:hypothetical protein [Acidobacteriota bacterium]MBI3658670.1 hypothetical protein [Acidobacteriota bacterium]
MRKASLITLASILTIGLTVHGQSRTSQNYDGPKIGGTITETWADLEDFSALVKNSPLIIKGKVLKTQSRIERKGAANEWPFTYSDIEIKEVYKDTLGTNPRTITVSQIGGPIDGIVAVNQRNPAFEIGDEYILILRPNDGKAWVVAQSIGRFHLDNGRVYQKHKSANDKLDNGWNALLKANGYPTDVPEQEFVSKIESLELPTPNPIEPEPNRQKSQWLK